jgi:ABC-type dipeptide/oligopeptide/nickel transport system permease subunit
MSSTRSAITIEEAPTYWSIVWGQFRKNGASFVALQGIWALFAIAVFAPVFSSRVPFYYSDADGLTFPWFRALLFNRNIYSNPIDLFFNLLLVAFPLYVAMRIVVPRLWTSRKVREARRLRGRVWWAVISTLTLFYVWLLFVDPRLASPEYRDLVVEGAGRGLFPPLRIQYDDTLHGLEGPGLRHLLGEDDSGRDIFVRMLFGTRVSLAVGVIAVSIYMSIGTVMGAVAGYFGGRIDLAVQRLVEIFLCFPSFFLILTFVAFLDRPDVIWVMVIIGVLGWTGPARLVRGEFLRLKNIDFVAAARACGLTNSRIIFGHILPNALGPLLVNATFGVASAILVESSLSFLGLGDPTLPSWGRILSYGRFSGDTTMMLVAGFAIFVTVSVFNLAGEGFRDALDPKLRR